MSVMVEIGEERLAKWQSDEAARLEKAREADAVYREELAAREKRRRELLRKSLLAAALALSVGGLAVPFAGAIWWVLCRSLLAFGFAWGLKNEAACFCSVAGGVGLAVFACAFIGRPRNEPELCGWRSAIAYAGLALIVYALLLMGVVAARVIWSLWLMFPRSAQIGLGVALASVPLWVAWWRLKPTEPGE